MSLETVGKTEKKQTKTQQARDLAVKYKDKPYHEARKLIMEEVEEGCSRSTATKALKWVEKQQKKEKTAKPKIVIAADEEKKPEFLEKPKEMEEITPPAPIEEITTAEVEEQLEVFKDMLRGIHVLLVSKEGVLGEKYGRTKEQVVQCSDQLYRWLTRRYGVEDLEKYDTVLLILSYGTLVGGIAKEVIDERRKKTSKKT